MSLKPIVDGGVVGTLLGAQFGISSPWYWLILFAWATGSTFAGVYDDYREIAAE